MGSMSTFLQSASNRRAAVVAAMLLAAAALCGCQTAGQGAVSGGASAPYRVWRSAR